MSFDEHPKATSEGEPEHTPECTGHHQPKPNPDTITLEEIAKMSREELARVAGSMEPDWHTGFGSCQGECR